MLEQEHYVREKLREFDLRQGTYEPVTLTLKAPVAPVVRRTGRVLLWLGQRLESWAQPVEPDAQELDFRGKAS
jgi:hypothetical protein